MPIWKRNKSSGLQDTLTESDLEDLFQLFLGRNVGNDEYRRSVADGSRSIYDAAESLRHSEEFINLVETEYRRFETERDFGDQFYRNPKFLTVNPIKLTSILAVGSCLLEAWIGRLADRNPDCIVDYYLPTDLPELPQRPISDYQFQIIQIPIRILVPDHYFSRLRQDDSAAHQELFRYSEEALRVALDRLMRWNREHGILTIVLALVVPQQNMIGRLMPRHDLRNPVYFLEKLNESLERMLGEYRQAYFFDTNAVAASLGAKYILEDNIAAFNHGSILGDANDPHDQGRIETPLTMPLVFRSKTLDFFDACWREMEAIYCTVRQQDSVKMVVIDLDDTLWRGVIADTDLGDMPTTEGWPLGFWEALLVLKRRGILLGIISKNEESRVLEAWPAILGNESLKLDDFAAYRINWAPKSQNMAEILEAVNLLPGNILYIDDNPVQRAEIQAAFPGIRVLGGTPALWRHILLWSPETQNAVITEESAARTEMIQAQIARDGERKTRTPEEFLASLNLRMAVFRIADLDHPRFARALELINKTNQFNTTGKRWTQEELGAAFASGTELMAFTLADRFTDYGLVGVLIISGSGIEQFVMSCRIMGLEAELAAVVQAISILRQVGADRIIAAMTPTERNLPCRDVYRRIGFEPVEGGWAYDSAAPLAAPAHIAVTIG